MLLAFGALLLISDILRRLPAACFCCCQRHARDADYAARVLVARML